MFWVLVAMGVALVVALVVISRVAEDDGGREPDEGPLEDLLGP